MSARLPAAVEASAAEIAAKAAAARRAAAAWRRTTVGQRVKALRGLWRALAARREEIRAVVHEETGKPLVEADLMEVGVAGLLVDWMTSAAPRVLEDKAAWKPWFLFNKRAYERRVPRGVVGVITPWNMPFLIPFGDAFAAMLAGNAALLKPSERATKTALWLEGAAAATALLPEGLLSVVTGGPSVGEAVVDAADMTAFTGSVASGRAVAARAAGQLKPALLELGGKHPMIVLADAALERAAAAAVWGACANAGQLCVGVERVFVEAEVHDRFVELVRTRVSALRQRLDGRDADLGRLAFAPLFDRVQEQIEDARAKGARVIGGEIIDRAELLMAPALVLDARMDMRVMSEECFGPVIPIMKVFRAEEAVALSNAGPEGLAASVWTRDLGKGEGLAAALEAGLVGVNEPATHYALGALPFGGMKKSGLGRRHGEEGLLAFTQAQSVLVHEWPEDAPDPWWFPYGEGKARLLRRLLGLP
ncbi:MAG: aldehyde dehydrogenase family protein [Elusimicrobia bacterium]|nr:aldehyde dehydrogenase family protein [Elusimicrobiota bacterium]